MVEIAQRLPGLLQRRLAREGERLSSRERSVAALDPRRVLRRGYSLSYDESGRLIRSASQLKAGQPLKSVFAEGSAESRVERVENEPSDGEERP